MILLWIVYLASAGTLLATARWLRRSIPVSSAIVLLILPIAFCLPAFFLGRTILPTGQVAHFPPWSSAAWTSPRNPYLNDVATQLAPWTLAVRRAWREGSLPWRNRWTGCGEPLLANGQSAAFSPFTLAMAALPLPAAFTLLAALKLLVALFGTWLWLSELEVSAFASMLGAIAFAFSMAMTPLLLFPLSAVFCLWPWALFAIEMTLHPERSRRGPMLLGVVLAAWILAGHPETACVGGTGIALFLLGRLILREPTLRPRRLLAVGVAVLVAIGLTAWLWVPEVLAVGASGRVVAARAWRDVVRGHGPHFPGWALGFLTSIFPQALGDGIAAPRLSAAPFGFVEMALAYFGAAGWSLALLILRPGARRDRRAIALLFPMACGLAVGTGTWPILEGFLAVPLLDLVLPPRYFSWMALFGSALAAFELDRLMKDARKSDWRTKLAGMAPLLLGTAVLAVVWRLRPLHLASGGWVGVRASFVETAATLAVVFVLLLVFGWLPRHAPAAAALLAAVALCELAFQGLRLYQWGDPLAFFPSTPLVEFLAAQAPPFRVLGEGSAIYPATNVFAGVEEIRTHDPMERRDYVGFLDRTCGYDPASYFKHIRNRDAPVLDFLNVRFLVSGDPARPESARWRRVYSGPDGSVLENVHVLPRVFAPRRIRFDTADGPDAAPLPGADWACEATISQGLGDLSGTRDARSNVAVDVLDYRETTNSVEFTTRSEGPGSSILVTSMVQDGGWSAVDERGSRLATAKANGIFLGLLLASGRHRIRLDYVAPGFREGGALSALTLAGILGFLALRRMRGSRDVPLDRGGWRSLE